MNMRRRDFVRSAGAAAVVYNFVDSKPVLKAAGPNDEIGLGWIGVGIRGDFLHRSFKAVPGVRPVIAADCYDGYLTHAKELTTTLETTKDYRAVLDRKDVDAVAIATPDHWHRRIVLDALAAGKHVYCEKPMTWSIEEGKEIIAAVEKSGKVLQVGSGAGSSAIPAKIRELVKSGALGKVSMVRMANHRNTPEGAWVYPIPPDASPQTIDWERFQGPATKKRAYDPKVFFRWRCWWEYSGGVATDLFVHLLTFLHSAMDVTGPHTAVSQGGIYRWDDGRTVPDTMETVFEYPGNFLANLYVNLGNSRQTARQTIYGSEGTLVVEGFNKVVLYPEPSSVDVQRYSTACWPEAMRKQYFEEHGNAERPKPKPSQEYTVERGPSHQQQFVNALRQGKAITETAVDGHYAAGAAHLANLAFRKGRRMKWDLKTGKVSEG